MSPTSLEVSCRVKHRAHLFAAGNYLSASMDVLRGGENESEFFGESAQGGARGYLYSRIGSGGYAAYRTVTASLYVKLPGADALLAESTRRK